MKRAIFLLLLPAILSSLLPTSLLAQTSERWPEDKANAWYQQQPWLVGANYIPASAINELEMWQADTFDPRQIDQELGWAEGLGMNTMHVFLHDLLWEQDSPGFKQRIDQFLTIAAKHHIRPMLVLFDSCWDPEPKVGLQRPPMQGVHNSGWVQSPGAKALQDSSQYPRLKSYVVGVVSAFANDQRILAWDIWNEPGGFQYGYYEQKEPPNKIDLVKALLPQAFAWARSAGSTFDGVLPIAKKYLVGAINWGLVVGKTQTNLPWESWDHPYVLGQPQVWFHDVFKADGTPYRESEAQLIRQLTGTAASAKAK